MSVTPHSSFADWLIDTRMISPIRLVLAAAALLIIYIDPSQPDRLVRLTYSLLIGYTVYSAILLLGSIVTPRFLPMGMLHWLDMTWYVALISVSSGTSSIFFIFFFFPILVASFRWGFASGLRVTVLSAILFVTVGYFTASEAHFELNRFLLRSVTLLFLGYMIAHWGGSEIESKRRLQLLKDVTNLANPRFGIDRTISLGLERLRSFYDAQACILVYRFKAEIGYQLTRVDRGKAESALPNHVPDGLAKLLLAPEPNTAVMRATQSSAPLLYEIDSSRTWRDKTQNLSSVLNSLGAKHFTSVPVSYRGNFIARLYVVDSTRRRIGQSDVEFMLHLIEHLSPLLDNIGLLDRLASEAAEQERRKLARDIHDSVIQPYVGLQLGLAAVRQKLLVSDSSALKDVNELCEVTNDEVRGLRNYLDELKAADARQGVLFPAVRRFAGKYLAATGIHVEITGDEKIQLNDRLAAEAFQMIAEALSNVRRHTSAHEAEVKITSDQRNLILNISNEITDGIDATLFRPKSISERAAALGGHTEVYGDNSNRTVVAIRIPL
jgi:signal transduction histidine kinase